MEAVTMFSHESLKAASLIDPRLDSSGTGLREVDDITPAEEQDAELRFGPDQLRYYVMRNNRVPKGCPSRCCWQHRTPKGPYTMHQQRGC